MVSGIQTTGMFGTARMGMAKHASESRFGEKTPSDLRNAAALMKSLAEEFEGYAARMEQNKLRSVKTDGAEQLSVGIEKLGRFAIHCHTNIVKMRDDIARRAVAKIEAEADSLHIGKQVEMAEADWVERVRKRR